MPYRDPENGLTPTDDERENKAWRRWAQGLWAYFHAGRKAKPNNAYWTVLVASGDDPTDPEVDFGNMSLTERRIADALWDQYWDGKRFTWPPMDEYLTKHSD
jgi:hypothetical protein